MGRLKTVGPARTSSCPRREETGGIVNSLRSLVVVDLEGWEGGCIGTNR